MKLEMFLEGVQFLKELDDLVYSKKTKPTSEPDECDLCHGSGINYLSQLWPGRINCRACKGSGKDPYYEITKNTAGES